MAIVSKVQIANMALANVSAKDTIESLTENSTEAKKCNLFYDQARIMTLEAFDWSFARKRQALATHGDDAPTGVWAYRYQYPADCLRAREMENPTVINQSIIRGVPAALVFPDAVPFSVEMSEDGTKSILTDLDEAVLIYTFDQENLQMYSRFFIQTLSYALGHMIAMPLTGKLSIKDDQAVKFAESLKAASAHDANEGVSRPPRDADWIRARY